MRMMEHVDRLTKLMAINQAGREEIEQTQSPLPTVVELYFMERGSARVHLNESLNGIGGRNQRSDKLPRFRTFSPCPGYARHIV